MSAVEPTRSAEIARTRPWTDYTPAQAVGLGDISERGDISGPRNEMGEECPWPWEPEQLVGAAFGQYHCGYCGAMVLAGIPHLDYSDSPDPNDAAGQRLTAHPEFEAFKERALRDPAVRDAYERAQRRELTYGLDKRQARRLVRRLNLKGKR